MEEYSQLSVIVAPQEVEIPECCVSYCVDEEGNIIEPAVTVTERDGISITGVIEPSGSRVLTFQTEQSWYRFEASWNDTEKSVVELLDWFCEHHFNLASFA